MTVLHAYTLILVNIQCLQFVLYSLLLKQKHNLCVWRGIKTNSRPNYSNAHKLLHEHTILHSSRCKKIRYCERNFDSHWNQRCLENGAKFSHWMSQNLISIFFLWIDLMQKCVFKLLFSQYVQIKCNLDSVFDLVSQYNGLFIGI